MSPYATPTDLANWMTPKAVPENATALLRAASNLIDYAIANLYYAVDGSGNPTDLAQLAALKNATCIQAAAWAEMGLDPDSGGAYVAGIAQSKSIGTAKVSYADTTQAQSDRARYAKALVPQAFVTLRLANMISTRVWSWG